MAICHCQEYDSPAWARSYCPNICTPVTRTTLQKLSTWDLPNLVSFGERGLPPNLQTFHNRDCEKLRPSVENWGLQRLIQFSSEDVLKTLLKEQLLLTALHTLAISYLSSLKSLDRNGLQHRTSLQKLYIGRCDSLDFLPKQGFPASISFLNITRCPSMKKRYETKKGKEWRKIAHIPCLKRDDIVTPGMMFYSYIALFSNKQHSFSSSLHVAAIFGWVQIYFCTYTALLK
ncbi:hypothetical protein DVH24_013576 [Malus domestica]|uniref:Uncharacterized protein n=1 Tax=Malus domestica TaxID=3750 RepID=A0A498JBY3_MALDO|nr:hypothetical protein DVH24_013576 [Malus domestica]